jgi:hypothetical protein
MATERRWQKLLLGALASVLLVIVYRIWPAAAPSAARAPASNNQAASSGPRAQQHQAPSGETPDVHLEALDDERPKPGATDRNLFRYKSKAPPPPPPSTGRGPAPTTIVAPPPVVAGPPQPPPPPPITLKFLGTVERPGQGGIKIAILSDGRGGPIFGKEGEIVEGRYRILKIGVESIELAYADGRGRQTIRQTGQ